VGGGDGDKYLTIKMRHFKFKFSSPLVMTKNVELYLCPLVGLYDIFKFLIEILNYEHFQILFCIGYILITHKSLLT